MREAVAVEPIVSVIMPTYNHGHFIRDAISSVCGQDHKNLELIIVDNYSDDDTEAVVRSFADGRIRYLKFRNNGIIAASRNAGLREAKGDYIAFIDSDDAWGADKISRQMDCLKKYPDVALVACNLRIFRGKDRTDRTLLGDMKKEVRGNLFDKIIFKNSISCSSVLLRAGALAGIGIFDEDPGIVSLEDWDLWLRIAHSYPICIIPEVLGSYTIHEDNVSKKSDMLNKMLSVVDRNTDRGWISPVKADLLKVFIHMRKLKGAGR